MGDIAPDFKIQSMSAGQPLAELSDMKGKYVLLSFWASYDAHSRMQNASLSNVLRSASRNDNVEMVSVSFDEYQSIFKETVRKDQIVTPTCFVETKGESSGLFKKYRLGRGFTNYLLDENGVDFLVLHQAVGVDARPGDVESAAHKGRHGRDIVADLVFEVIGNLGDDRGVHAVKRPPQ